MKAEDTEMVRIASVQPKLDDVGDSGVHLADPVERALIAGYLAAGTAILYTTATTADRYDPGLANAVGLSVRSDGEWVWSDVITYYLERYGLAPEDDLLEHIREMRYDCPPLSDSDAAAALAAFTAARGGSS